MQDSTVVKVASDITDKLGAIFQAIGEKVGAGAAYAWPKYVHYMQAQAIGNMVAWAIPGAIAIAGGLIGLHRADDDEKEIFFWLTLAGCGVMMISIGMNLPTVIAPEGAAIVKIVGQLR